MIRSASSFWIVATIECGVYSLEQQVREHRRGDVVRQVGDELQPPAGRRSQLLADGFQHTGLKLFLFRSASSCSIVTCG